MQVTGYNLENSLMIYTTRCQEIHHRVQEAKEPSEKEEVPKGLWEKLKKVWDGSEFNTIANDFNEIDLAVRDLVCHTVDENDYLTEILIIERNLPPLKKEVEKIKDEVAGIDDRGARKIKMIANCLLQRNVSKIIQS